MSATNSTYAGWAILELMGHRRLAGYVREVELAGQGMLRLDIPEHASAVCTCGSDQPEGTDHEHHQHDCMLFADPAAAPADVTATQFYSPSALYCMTPTTEAIARALAQRTKPEPAHQWELPAPRGEHLEGGRRVDGEDERGSCECGHGRVDHAAEFQGGCLIVGCDCEAYDEVIPF